MTLRCYRSAAATTGSPLILFFHGGGWVLGSLDTHDPLARRICNAAGATVLSVDYRLAPEHPFPAAPEDCYAALQWAAANAPRFDTDASRIAVTGDSAGGNLAAVVCPDGPGPWRDDAGPPGVDLPDHRLPISTRTRTWSMPRENRSPAK